VLDLRASVLLRPGSGTGLSGALIAGERIKRIGSARMISRIGIAPSRI